MTDDLRTRLTAVIRSALLEVDYSDAEKSADGEQWVFIDGTVIPENLADAVIRELADECRAGCMWKIPNRYADMTDQQRTILSAQRAIDEHNARDRSHCTEGEQ